MIDGPCTMQKYSENKVKTLEYNMVHYYVSKTDHNYHHHDYDDDEIHTRNYVSGKSDFIPPIGNIICDYQRC